jgi:hypothetical protein
MTQACVLAVNFANHFIIKVLTQVHWHPISEKRFPFRMPDADTIEFDSTNSDPIDSSNPIKTYLQIDLRRLFITIVVM